MARLLGDPVMTEHLGGPESPEQLERRLHRYAEEMGGEHGQMFVIEAGPERVPAGSVGYWGREWHGETVWETGWHVLPEFQGRGIATEATRECVALAAEERRYPSIHAFPSVDNAPSNAICRKVGFTLIGQVEFEYPKGHWMTCNDWALDLPDARVDPRSDGQDVRDATEQATEHGQDRDRRGELRRGGP